MKTYLNKTSALALVLALGTVTDAWAQSVEKKPNILFVIDTSGSMEYETGADTYPTCYPAESDPTQHTKSRWIEVLEVLTGSIDSYACAAEDRSSSEFLDEYAMPGSTDNPPDAFYRNPYHRPLSSSCAITPFKDPPVSLSNAFDWDPPTEAPWPVNTSLPGACATSFSQAANGFIDTYTDVARFGLMTFDPLPDAEVGHSGASTYGPQYPAGVRGAWSYYVNGAAGEARPAEGKPADCEEPQDLEVGVRNGAAPAAEGKMIYFGNQDLSASRDNDRHSRIEQVLLASRPYGATPLNGALDDVRAFFWYDSDLEPTGVTGAGPTLYGTAGDGTRISPRYDEYVSCGCRDQHVILITDGEPNLDLRPECAAAAVSADPNFAGDCPYDDTPAEILDDMASQGTTPLSCSPLAPDNKYQILTHVVGFATDTYASGTQNCVDLPANEPTWDQPGGVCETTTDEDLEVCCTLHELAEAGGTELPYIAPDGASLQDALGDIMKAIIPTSSSRTQPVRSPGIGRGEDDMAAFRLLTSYETLPGPGQANVWRGNIERLRWVCESGVPVEQEKSLSDGDDFGYNLAKNLSTRDFVTFQPNPVAGVYSARDSLRPHATADEGAGTRGGSMVTGDVSTMLALPAALLEIDYTTDAACAGASNDASCRNRILNWTFGIVDDLGNERCPTPSDENGCSVIGDIFQSTPTIVNRPTANVEDETYELFAQNQQSRMMTAYVSSNDGMLHSFAVSPNDTTATDPAPGIEDDTAANEQYAFIPPAVFPLLKDQHPGNRLMLLDGEAVTMDVVATAQVAAYPFKLERSLSGAQGLVNTWRTVLVQAFGGAQPGYFALDITDPDDPDFLWQLTTTSAGNNLFGTGGTPIITTVSIKEATDSEQREVAVAVLPGGRGDSPLGGPCARNNPDIGGTNANTHYDTTVTGSYTIRPDVNCYADTANHRAARSLTVVRLDSGEILRRFTVEEATPQVPDSNLTGVFSNGSSPLLDSPISGTPAVYPAGAGMVADRIFVGDQDGTLWRVDVSLEDPGDWTMQLFFDGYTGQAATDGKPIVIAPALSVDERGQITVAFGTGDQDPTGASTDEQFVWSLTEVEGTTDFAAKVNWYHPFTGGEHILGPLSLLGGVLYFSTVIPEGAGICEVATSKIFGVDYIAPADGANLDDGGKAALKITGEPSVEQYKAAEDLVGGNNPGPIFGVTPEFIPSCATDDTQETDYYGKSRTKVTEPSSSQLGLVFQTANSGSQGADLGFRTGFEVVALDPPRTASTILSWAAILD